MFKMKTTLYLFAAVLVIVSCSDDEGPKLISAFQVKVSYPDTYVSTAAANATVKLKNLNTLEEVSQTTGTDGIANFTELLPGNYQINASRTLTAGEASELTGYSTEVFLNGAIATQEISDLTTSVDVKLSGSSVGGLVFKQIFYSMSKTPAGANYLQDQFYEIYNNSTDTLYADQLCLADVQGNPGNSTSTSPTGFKSDASNVYVRAIWRVPGTGKQHPIVPGGTFVIAQTALNHLTDKLATSADLGSGVSAFEVYVENAANQRDVDVPEVPNLDRVFAAAPGFYWNTYVFGASMIIFKHNSPETLARMTEPGTTSTTEYVQVPVASILDAVDLLANANASAYKRIPSSLDAGFQYCSGTYVNEAVIRKVKSTAANGRKILQDTNNTTADFEVITPPKPKGWKVN